MECYDLELSSPFEKVTVNIQYKDIKNVHLKVFRNLKVVLSVPLEITDDWVINFLLSKSSWIEKQLQKYKDSSGYNNLTNVKSGSSTQLLGKDRRIIQKHSKKNYVVEEEKYILVYADEEKKLHQQTLEKWWRKTAYKVYSEEMDEIYSRIFKKYGIEKPVLYVRKMKTLWGSCTPSKNKIILNQYLLKADLRCIQYVILHELTHLLYPYHNADFYNFLTVQMPDWKERKKQLDLDVVQGL